MANQKAAHLITKIITAAAFKQITELRSGPIHLQLDNADTELGSFSPHPKGFRSAEMIYAKATCVLIHNI
jgi:hypothetical protein